MKRGLIGEIKNLIKRKKWALFFLIPIGALLAFMLLPLTIASGFAYLFWRIAKSKPSLRYGLVAIVLILGLWGTIGLYKGISNQPPKERWVTKQAATEVPQKTPKPEIKTEQPEKEKPKPQPSKELTIMDKLWIALDTSIKTRDKYDISYDGQKKLAVLSRKPADYWDETAVVKSGYNTLINYGKEAFKIDNVEIVEVVLFNNFTDQYGKESEEKAVDFAMEKGEFSKYNWDNLKGQNIFNQMTESCSVHYIHPAVFKNLKKDKLIYF